jgi:hypothetical protein
MKQLRASFAILAGLLVCVLPLAAQNFNIQEHTLKMA